MPAGAPALAQDNYPCKRLNWTITFGPGFFPRILGASLLLTTSGGTFGIFLDRPMSLWILAIRAVVLVAGILMRRTRRRRPKDIP